MSRSVLADCAEGADKGLTDDSLLTMIITRIIIIIIIIIILDIIYIALFPEAQYIQTSTCDHLL